MKFGFSQSVPEIQEVFVKQRKFFHLLGYICDMIKGNESDVGNVDFKLQAKRGDKFLCFRPTLFFKLKNCSYLQNQMSY